jgi:hypothetical protein
MECGLFSELIWLVVGGNKCSDNFVFAEPVGSDFNPILLDDFNSRQRGKLLGCWTLRGPSQSNQAVLRQSVV